MAVLTADHYIRDARLAFAGIGGCRGRCSKGALVTLGISGCRPSTGYGYIKTRPESTGREEFAVYQGEKVSQRSRHRHLAADSMFAQG